MTSNGHKITNKTVERYLTGLTDSLLAYKAERYDIKGKRHLVTLNKYYVADVALRQLMLTKQEDTDAGHILENVVYLELLRRDYRVATGNINGYEVDFVAIKRGVPTYIQVSVNTSDPNTLQRELRPLKALKNHHTKLLLTLDETVETDHNGIREINALDWLLKGS